MLCALPSFLLRKILKDILSPAEVGELKQALGKIPLNTVAIQKVIEGMMRLGAVTITQKSYATIERNPAGHEWHVDTGDSNHMLWCRMSASVGLTPPSNYVGGAFQFSDPFEEYKNNYLSAIIYSSDQQHRVLPHEGDRTVLLIFLGETNGE